MLNYSRPRRRFRIIGAPKNIISELRQIEPYEYFRDVLSVFFNTEEVLEEKYAKASKNISIYDQLRYKNFLQQLRELSLTDSEKADIIEFLFDELISQTAQHSRLELNRYIPPPQTKSTPLKPDTRTHTSAEAIMLELRNIEPDEYFSDVLSVFFNTEEILEEKYGNDSQSMDEWRQRYLNLLKQLRELPLTGNNKAAAIEYHYAECTHPMYSQLRFEIPSKMAALEAEIRSLQGQLQKNQTQAADAIATWRKENAALSAQHATEMDKFKRKFEQYIMEARDKLQSVTKTYQAKTQELNSDIEELTHQLQLLKKQNSELQVQYDAIQKEKQTLTQKWEETNTTMAQAKAALISEKNNALAEAELLKKQMSELEAQYHATERQKLALLNKLEEIKTATAKDSAALVSEKEAALAEVRLLKQQMSDLQAKYLANENEKQLLADLNQVLEREIQVVETHMQRADWSKKILTEKLEQQQTMASETSLQLMHIGIAISNQSIGPAYALSPNQLNSILFTAIVADKKNYAAWNHLAELYLKYNAKNELEALIKHFEETFSLILDDIQQAWVLKWKDLLLAQASVESTFASAPIVHDNQKRTNDERADERQADPRKRLKSRGSFSNPTNLTPTFFANHNPPVSPLTPPSTSTSPTGGMNPPSK